MLKLILFVVLMMFIFKWKKSVIDNDRFLRKVTSSDIIKDIILMLICAVVKNVTGWFFVNITINCICFVIGILLFVMFVRDVIVFMRKK